MKGRATRSSRKQKLERMDSVRRAGERTQRQTEAGSLKTSCEPRRGKVLEGHGSATLVSAGCSANRSLPADGRRVGGPGEDRPASVPLRPEPGQGLRPPGSARLQARRLQSRAWSWLRGLRRSQEEAVSTTSKGQEAALLMQKLPQVTQRTERRRFLRWPVSCRFATQTEQPRAGRGCRPERPAARRRRRRRHGCQDRLPLLRGLMRL